MAGDVSSLGIGSGVLTADVIEQLKANDESRVVTPLDNKIALNQQKQESYSLLSSLMTTFKASASALSYSTVFEAKTVDVSGDAKVTVEAGANVESFSLETVALAQKNIIKLGAFADKSVTPVASGVFAGTETLNISIGTQSFDISYDATTTLEDLAQLITDTAGGAIGATVLQTGDAAYNLVLTSNVTGADQAITLTDNGGLLDPTLFAAYDAITNPDGMQEVQVARDATFKFNGIEATRSTNEISDFITGVTMTLKTEGEIAYVDINNDNDGLVGEMELFVSSYNSLVTNLKDMTVSKTDSGTTGIFADESFIKSISRDLSGIMTTLNSDNQSLMDFGIDIDRYGTMSFTEDTLRTKLQEDQSAVQLFFAGGIDPVSGDTKTGFFEKLNDSINNYTGYNGLFSNFETDLNTRYDNLSENRTRAIQSIEDRYAIMKKRFTAYDAIISRINSQFSSLQMMIDAASSSSG